MGRARARWLRTRMGGEAVLGEIQRAEAEAGREHARRSYVRRQGCGFEAGGCGADRMVEAVRRDARDAVGK